MFEVSNDGVITVSRGDTFSVPIFINSGTDLEPMRYVLSENDSLYFGIMEYNQPFEEALVRKKYDICNFNDNRDVVLELDSNDTVCLNPGDYYYQVKLQSVHRAVTQHTDYKIGMPSLLKKGCLLTKGSLVQGVPVEVDESGYYCCETDIQLQERDYIKCKSILIAGSVINGTEIQLHQTVTTVIPRTIITIIE